MDQRHVGEFKVVHDLQPFMQLVVRLRLQGAVRSDTGAILDCLIQQRSKLSGIKRPSIPTIAAWRAVKIVVSMHGPVGMRASAKSLLVILSISSQAGF